jgi:hypothetical protein
LQGGLFKVDEYISRYDFKSYDADTLQSQFAIARDEFVNASAKLATVKKEMKPRKSSAEDNAMYELETWFLVVGSSLQNIKTNVEMKLKAAPLDDHFKEVLLTTDRAFLGAETILRPGISDLPGVSVREFLERIVRTKMDNGQAPRLIRIAKADNEYTVELQMKERVILLFSHILSYPSNGKAAILQSVLLSGRVKVEPFDFARLVLSPQ